MANYINTTPNTYSSSTGNMKMLLMVLVHIFSFDTKYLYKNKAKQIEFILNDKWHCILFVTIRIRFINNY